MVLKRVDPEVNKYSVDVTHRVDDPDREALEEIRALRKLGTAARSCSNCTARMAWIVSRALEAADTARRLRRPSSLRAG